MSGDLHYLRMAQFAERGRGGEKGRGRGEKGRGRGEKSSHDITLGRIIGRQDVHTSMRSC